MRLLFFILLLVNAVVLGYFTLMRDGSRPAYKPHAEMKAEAIRMQSELPKADAKPMDATKRVCLEWNGLTDADFSKAQLALEAMGLKDHVALPPGTDYWVHIPPLKSKQDAEKKISELHGLGVEDGKLVEDAGKWRYAISLAAFASKEEADFYLKQLRDKGIRSAKILQRLPASITLTLVDVDPALTKQLEGMAADYDKSEMKNVACSVR